jgi:hypothetical protein
VWAVCGAGAEPRTLVKTLCRDAFFDMCALFQHLVMWLGLVYALHPFVSRWSISPYTIFALAIQTMMVHIGYHSFAIYFLRCKVCLDILSFDKNNEYLMGMNAILGHSMEIYKVVQLTV